MRSFGRPRVLVCDDEPAIRAICERALGHAGYEPVAVARGVDAVIAVEREAFDVLLLDVRMPDMDGPQVLGAVREHDPDLPCVIISGYSAFDDAIECLRHGAVDFVRKPFDLELVVRAVDRALASTHLKADSAILAASRSIFSSLDAREIARRVLGVVRSLLQAAEATITLGGDEPIETFRIAFGDDEVTPGATLAAGAWRRLLELREPVVFSVELPGDADVVAQISPRAHSVLSHRLVVGDRAVGLLTAARAGGQRAFGERDLRRATLLSGHAALALENARLHLESQRRARELEHAIDRLVVAERIATVSRLSANLAHEVSNPACAVLASIEVARDALGAGRQAEAQEALGRAALGANAILDVVAALRPLAARSTRGGEPVDLRRVVEGAAMLASYEMRSRARLVVDIPEKLPLLGGDAAKLGQVFLNLLLNAAQAIEPGRPEEHQVRVVAAADAAVREVVVRVEDTGRGVPPDLLPRLFEPSVTTRAAEDGHGMGLAISRWILEEIGGAIRCVPDVARGAIFELRLPVFAGGGQAREG